MKHGLDALNGNAPGHGCTFTPCLLQTRAPQVFPEAAMREESPQKRYPTVLHTTRHLPFYLWMHTSYIRPLSQLYLCVCICVCVTFGLLACEYSSACLSPLVAAAWPSVRLCCGVGTFEPCRVSGPHAPSGAATRGWRHFWQRGLLAWRVPLCRRPSQHMSLCCISPPFGRSYFMTTFNCVQPSLGFGPGRQCKSIFLSRIFEVAGRATFAGPGIPGSMN